VEVALEVSVACRMATVGSSTAVAINRMRTIFFETIHLPDEQSLNSDLNVEMITNRFEHAVQENLSDNQTSTQNRLLIE